MEQRELEMLERLDRALRAERARAEIEAIVVRVERDLARRPGATMAWEPIPLACYDALPEAAEIRSSWVFILRAGAVTGAERHPNSRQRMTSWRGAGKLQTRSRATDPWTSHLLRSDGDAPLLERWISIPPDVWHQGVVPAHDWVVVSFQTAGVEELVEERPDPDHEGAYRRRSYVEE